MEGTNNRNMESMEPDFKSSRSDFVIEIKGLIILLSESLSSAEAEHRFCRSASEKPSSVQAYANVYNHLSQIVKLTREILPADDRTKVEKWLGSVNGTNLDRTQFIRSAQEYSRMIQNVLFEIGIKDTNIKKPTPFAWDYYLPEQA